MKAGVITIPERGEPLRCLLNVLEPEIGAVSIFCDDGRKGQFWNYWRMFSSMLSNAGEDEPVLLMTDDAMTVPGFWEMWNGIHA